MDHYAGIDVSLERSSVCVVDATGRIVREAKVASEPEALVDFFRRLGLPLVRVGLEAGPLFEWRQSEPTHILLVADRVGADIIVVRHDSPEVQVEAGGDDFQIHKPNAGGWSQRRFQRAGPRLRFRSWKRPRGCRSW